MFGKINKPLPEDDAESVSGIMKCQSITTEFGALLRVDEDVLDEINTRKLLKSYGGVHELVFFASVKEQCEIGVLYSCSIYIKTLEAACYAFPQLILALIVVVNITGMGSDLLDSCAESVSAPLVASISFLWINHDLIAMLYLPLLSSNGIILCLLITLFATYFFEVSNVKKIESALQKQLIIFTAAITARIAVVSIMALLSSFAIFNFRTQKDIKRWQLLLRNVVGFWAGRVGGVRCSLFMFLFIEEGLDALELELNKLSSTLSLEDKANFEGRWYCYGPIISGLWN